HSGVRSISTENFPVLEIKKMKNPSADVPWQQFCPHSLTEKHSRTEMYHFFYKSRQDHYVAMDFKEMGPHFGVVSEMNRKVVPLGVRLERRNRNLRVR